MSDNFLDTYEIKKATEDIKDMKSDLKEAKIHDDKQDERISNLEKKQAIMEHKLNTIINNTAQTNQMIRQSIFGAIATGVIGGVIALVWSQIGGG